ncbi:DUF2332 domain-containing protein [Demequina sp.]|uniref:DUF2332 domain-containing protein n=1 Tax=Demequina sp. TaxID=2050685 RepID=UPI003D1136C6
MSDWAHSSADRATREGVAAEIRGWIPAAADSPIYSRLAAEVCEDPVLLDVVARIDNVPPMNLLFGAVQFLRGGALPSVPYGEFRAFVLAHEEEIVRIGCTRRTQTNEARRCAVILPFVANAVAGFGDGARAHAIDIGTSAGLNLCLDRFAYDYGAGVVGDSALVLGCENRGGFALPSGVPQFASRTGLDLSPIDVEDADAVAWLEALVWPEHADRLKRLRAAIAIRRQTPVTMIAGDALETLAGVVEALPAGEPALIFHTIALYQLPAEAQATLDDIVASLAETRPLARVSFEPRHGSLFPLIHVGARPYDSPAVAQGHHHGAWLDIPPTPAPLAV